jgi:mono/diheme cytochrome c family protein
MVLYRDAIFMTSFFWSFSSQREFRCRAQAFKTILCSHRSNKRQEDKLSADCLSDLWPNYGFRWAADVELLYVSSELQVGAKAVFSGGDMKGLCQTVFLPVLFLVAIPASVALTKSRTAPADTIDIQRGRYLVEEVAKCPECHTPRNARGELDRQAWLQGAPIWIMPVRPIPNWADRAPALAGFPSFTEEQGERVLEQGTGPEGETLRPPMHIYHMKHSDAKAVIAYLKSLPRSVH